MTLDERREELELIRRGPGGEDRVIAIYTSRQRDAGSLTPEAMIDELLIREFPDGTMDRRRVEVGDFVRTADDIVAKVVAIDDAYCDAYVRLYDTVAGARMRLVKIASLEKPDALY